MSDKVVKLIEDVKSLTVLELSELVKALEEEFGVSAAAPVAVAAAPCCWRRCSLPLLRKRLSLMLF